MRDLSVLIPARNEMWLQRTVEDVLAHSRADTEAIVVLDGEWPLSPLPDHPRVRVTHSKTIIGQRAATNLAARMSSARYVMKLDAHCSVEDGFDAKLMSADDGFGRGDVTQIPRMYNLHAFSWKCTACGEETYQGPTPTVPCVQRPRTEMYRLTDEAKARDCQSRSFVREVKWAKRDSRRTDFWRFDHELHFQYFDDYKRRPHAQAEIADVMSSVGACFFMRRDRFFELGGLDEAAGSWGQFGTEIACKSWLSGGRHVVNKSTWFAHLFRTQGGDFGFPYPNPTAAVDAARTYTNAMWMHNRWPSQRLPLSWLVDKFAPLPGWHEPIGRAQLAEVNTAGQQFKAKAA